ncbi:MAG: hypothetical protein WCJ35_22790 [Planctomycetota bacterium]
MTRQFGRITSLDEWGDPALFRPHRGGLKSRDGKPLSEFEITAAEGKFAAAEAVIDGDTVVVHAKEVESPAQVRFGWRNDANPNLVNKEGLPASPFQTNNWQGGTGE